MLDIPGGHGKVPIGPGYLGDDGSVEDPAGTLTLSSRLMTKDAPDNTGRRRPRRPTGWRRWTRNSCSAIPMREFASCWSSPGRRGAQGLGRALDHRGVRQRPHPPGRPRPPGPVVRRARAFGRFASQRGVAMLRRDASATTSSLPAVGGRDGSRQPRAPRRSAHRPSGFNITLHPHEQANACSPRS